MAESANPNRARDHLANERKFLAWVQTEPRLWRSGSRSGLLDGAATVDGASGTSWAQGDTGLGRLVWYQQTRTRLVARTFESAGVVLNRVTILTVLFGLVLAADLIYIAQTVGRGPGLKPRVALRLGTRR